MDDTWGRAVGKRVGVDGEEGNGEGSKEAYIAAGVGGGEVGKKER